MTETPLKPVELKDFQTGVDQWMDACFGDAIKADALEREDRFIEECLELAQTNPAFTADRAHALVDYVFGRPVGDPFQETGGVMVTLAARSNTAGISIQAAADTELARVWTKVEAIRAKQAAKPTGSALPIAAWNQRTVDTELLEALKPFAAMAAAYDPEDDGDDEQDAWAYNARPTIGQLRRARAAITKAEAGS